MRKQLLGKSHSYTSFTPAPYEFMDEQFSIFSAIEERDILLHHPYDSYETVITFLEHASIDPSVVGIKMTLYRVSSVDSPIVNALVRAAKNGKHVSVLIEIKARFDESRNIELISKLKQAGVNILLGLEYLKTHCKMCMVLRKEDDGHIKVYSHLATGNYNEKTSKIYSDLSYFTAKQKIGMDLLNIFNILSGVSSPDEKLQRVFYAPVNLRKTLTKCIDKEIDNAKKGKPAGIFLKLNSISDVQIVNKLYEAADAGVKIYIICRGVCSIVHQKNIYVKSIVGRFLEHSRIYCFKNNDDPLYFISSADLLTRNLDRRVETLVSLKDKNVIDKLKEIIFILKEDKQNSFKMNEDGDYKKMKGNFDSHEWFIQSASSSLKLKIPKKKK
jgi:polyphosphate kinase